jgi:hypothetical protein
MDLLIDAQGHRQQKCAIQLPCAIWRKGFIHIRKEKRGIIVSLSPALVKGPTVAGAVYAIAEMNPEFTSLIIEKENCVAVVFDTSWKAACRRICELVATGQHIQGSQMAAFRHSVEPSIEPEELEEPEHIIASTLTQHSQCNPESLTRMILEHLWEAGYDVRPNRC